MLSGCRQTLCYCGDAPHPGRLRSANSNNNSGLSVRLMPLNIPALMTSPQSKVAPAAPALTLNGLLMAAGEKE